MSKRDDKTGAPIWTGTITCRTMRVPVRLWRAQPTERPSVPLTTLHRACMAPVKRLERCSECGDELRAEDKMTAFELARGEYVPVDREDLPRPEAAERQAIEVEDWVPLAHIDPIQLDRTYYLAPAEGTARIYALLHRSMLQTGTAAIARVTLRTRESLCAIYPRGQWLALSTLHIASEMTELDAIPAGADGVAVDERSFNELCSTLARHTVRYNPYRYRDRQTAAAMSVIQERIADQTAITRLPAPRDAKIRGQVA